MEMRMSARRGNAKRVHAGSSACGFRGRVWGRGNVPRWREASTCRRRPHSMGPEIAQHRHVSTAPQHRHVSTAR
eukprot:1301353-Rhodomonas_salina.2